MSIIPGGHSAICLRLRTRSLVSTAQDAMTLLIINRDTIENNVLFCFAEDLSDISGTPNAAL
jgi:hypothetical protein